LLAKNILSVLRHRSVYILIAMIETTNYKEFLLDTLRQYNLDFKKLALEEKGVNLLAELIK